MSNLNKIFSTINALLFQKTNGRLGGKMGGQSVLLLHSIGRKSGNDYITPLSYYRDGKSYLVVASNWGKEDHPAWFKNLQLPSTTKIQVDSSSFPVSAHQAEGEEYKRLWELVTAKNNQYLKYQKGLARQIPIVILSPITNG